MKVSEASIQMAIVEFLSIVAAQKPICYFSVPNEGLMFGDERKDPKRFGKLARLKKMGMMDGTSDLVIIYEGKTMCMEVKKPGGKQSANQSRFEEKAKAAGATYRLVWSFEEAQAALASWGLMR